MTAAAFLPRITIDNLERGLIVEATALERDRTATALAEECSTTDDYAAVADRLYQLVYLERCLDDGDEIVIESRSTCRPVSRYMEYREQCIHDDLRALARIVDGDEGYCAEGQSLEEAAQDHREQIAAMRGEIATARALLTKAAHYFLRLGGDERALVELLIAGHTIEDDPVMPPPSPLHRLLEARDEGVLRLDADIVEEVAEVVSINRSEAEDPEALPDDAKAAAAYVDSGELVLQLAGRLP